MGLGRAGLIVGFGCLALVTGGCGGKEDKGPEDTQPQPDVVVEVRSELDLVEPPDGVDDLAADISDVEEMDLSPDGAELLDGADIEADIPALYPEEFPAAGVKLLLGVSPTLPYPWNGYLVPDSSSRTGRRVSFSGPFSLPEIFEGAAGMFSKAPKDLATMGGFGALGMLGVPLASAMDSEVLPAATDETPLMGVWLAKEGELVEVPFQIELQDCTHEDSDVRLLVLHPRRPLREGGRYLVAFSTDLEDAEGTSFAPFPATEVLLGLRAPYGTAAEQQAMSAAREETLATLATGDVGIPLEKLAAAYVFDVDVMESDLFGAARTIDEEIIEFDFDPDGDGEPNVFEAGTNGAPSGAGMLAFVQGRFKTPNFRNADGIMEYGEDGKLVLQGYEWRDFWLMIPEKLLEDDVPIAFVQHGLNSWKETMYGMGKDFVARGYVVAAFDFLHHKKNNEGGWDFVVIEKMGVTRDNFRQCALEYYAFVHGLKQLLGLDIQTLLPLPVQTGSVDFERIVITGHSLGAIESSLMAPLYQGEALVGLLNAGANLQYLMMGFLKETGLYDLAPCDMLHGLRIIASHIMSPMDPGIMARYIYEEPPEGTPAKPYLLEIGLKDGTVYWETGYDLARALGSPLLLPCTECWPYLDVAAAATTEVGTVQFDGGHQFFFGGDGPDIKAQAHAIYYNFVETGMADGTPELMWPVGEESL
jgi:hypothetical protein